jgi:hypothetical protein
MALRNLSSLACGALAAAWLCAAGPAAAQAMGGMKPGGMRETGPGGMWDELRTDLSIDSIGMRIYRKGILPGDRLAPATRAGSVLAPGQVACANCHQRSGLGAREGQQTIPPVVGAALYAPRPGGRSAYTDGTLAAAIRDGVDPDGRELSSLMPRYAMAPDELSQLIDYLKQLAARPSPGVSGGTVHLATVVTDDVPAARRQAMVDVMERYLRDLNDAADARPAADRPLHWKLHLWTLGGTAQGRRAQLQSYFAQQPVFALVGGLTTDTWLPVHEFCQVQMVPCLFPNTRLPVSGAPAYYALYFDRGSVLKAQLLARYFADHPAECPTGSTCRCCRGTGAARNRLRRCDSPWVGPGRIAWSTWFSSRAPRPRPNSGARRSDARRSARWCCGATARTLPGLRRWLAI